MTLEVTSLIPAAARSSSDSAGRSPKWDAATLRRMDWKRIQELVGLLLVRAGYQAEVAWVRPNGSCVLALAGARARSMVALVQCATWEDYRVSGNAVAELYRSVRAEGVERGIFVTPGSFDEIAVQFARGKNLELMDGKRLLQTLQAMPEAEQDYYLNLATAGAWDVPTCPACGNKTTRQNLAHRLPEEAVLQEVIFRRSEHVPHDLCCRSLTIQAGAEVIFSRGVRCEHMLVEGKAVGNFVVTEKAHIAPAATISGLLAARSIKLATGGVLDAEVRILNTTEIRPVCPQPAQELWVCLSYPRCNQTLQLRPDLDGA
jgi:hypothetical protein